MLKIVADIVRAVCASLRTNEAKPKEAGRGFPVEVRKGAVPAGGGSWSCVKLANSKASARAAPVLAARTSKGVSETRKVVRSGSKGRRSMGRVPFGTCGWDKGVPYDALPFSHKE